MYFIETMSCHKDPPRIQDIFFSFLKCFFVVVVVDVILMPVGIFALYSSLPHCKQPLDKHTYVGAYYFEILLRPRHYVKKYTVVTWRY